MFQTLIAGGMVQIHWQKRASFWRPDAGKKEKKSQKGVVCSVLRRPNPTRPDRRQTMVVESWSSGRRDRESHVASFGCPKMDSPLFPSAIDSPRVSLSETGRPLRKSILNDTLLLLKAWSNYCPLSNQSNWSSALLATSNVFLSSLPLNYSLQFVTSGNSCSTVSTLACFSFPVFVWNSLYGTDEDYASISVDLRPDV